MNSEQILLDLFKQRHYNVSRHKMQKIVVAFSTIASLCGIILMLIFDPVPFNVYVFSGVVILSGICTLLFSFKIVSQYVASLIFMIYVSLIFVPSFWYYTGLTGSAPYISLIILVSIISMFNGRSLRVLIIAYTALLMGLTVYSLITELPAAADKPALTYNASAYVFAVVLITGYMFSRKRSYEQMSEKFLKSSLKDDLTKLFSRNVMDMILEYEEKLYKEENQDYLLIMFDVDKFKEMNDTHGHVYGDIVLRNVADSISRAVRSSDFAVRYGGDEFLVVQTNSTKDSSNMFLKKIDETIKESFYSDFDLSASYGVAKRSECGSPMETLILADERLYAKKSAE